MNSEPLTIDLFALSEEQRVRLTARRGPALQAVMEKLAAALQEAIPQVLASVQTDLNALGVRAVPNIVDNHLKIQLERTR